MRLIMGERRFRACRELELDAIPAIVRATEDEKPSHALLENSYQRSSRMSSLLDVESSLRYSWSFMNF